MLIRKIRREDAAAVAALYAPYVENTTISFEYLPPKAEEIARRMDTLTAQFPWLAAEEDGVLLGYAYAAPNSVRTAYCWNANLSVYVTEAAMGRGVGHRLYEALEKILDRQGYQVLYGVVTGENTRSCRFHEAMGFALRAEFPNAGFKQGRWIGTYWYEKRLRTEAPAQPPISWRELDIEDILKGEAE